MNKSKSQVSLDENIYQEKWNKEGIYSYDFHEKSKSTFVIDTPPPTISGSLHIGHVFSYTQTDILARFQRMMGYNVFYPMGWDNNGLPTEKRVQNLYKIICDLSLSEKQELSDFSQNKISVPGDSDLESAFLNTLSLRKDNKKISDFKSVSRKNFIKICEKQTHADQKKYERLWRMMGLSVDWSQTYETISSHSQAISQRSFLDLYHKGFVENRFAPVYWDTQFQTAVAQADIEDRHKTGFYHNIKFSVDGEKSTNCVISTTRPELLPACVALVAHPEDDRYKRFFYKEAVTPLFFARVPVLPSPHADPEKGTGILMVCTFGDRDDVHFWQKTNHHQKERISHKSVVLPIKQIISQRGIMKKVNFQISSENEKNSHFPTETLWSVKPDKAHQFYSQLQGLSVFQARKKIAELLKESGDLAGEPYPKEQFVKFYEKGDYPLELLPARQWFIKVLDYKSEILEQGYKVQWHPPSMLKRYEEWVEGLNQDWCISRQRFFGVPFPVWYPLDGKSQPDYERPILPEPSFCPVDPVSTAPANLLSNLPNQLNGSNKSLYDSLVKYKEDKRGVPGGFIADKAVMDTWATSSLSPQINSHWGINSVRHEKLFPADLRPQAHEIIRTWAFYTIVKSFFHTKSVPWRHIAISGWVMDPQRLKMSKSKGDYISPEQLIKKYSADALRYWAGKARLGQDTIYDESIFKNGRRLSIKLSNAFRFMKLQVDQSLNIIQQKKDSSSFKPDFGSFSFKKSLESVTTLVDQAWIQYLFKQHQLVTQNLQNLHYSQALDSIEKLFWIFCDNYLELVKTRAYQLKNKTEGQSAVHALDISLYIFIKMLAPYMPYITESLWEQRYIGECSSVHASLWKLDKEALNMFHQMVETSFYQIKEPEEKWQKTVAEKSKQTDLKIKKSMSDNKEEKSNSLKDLLDFAFYILEQVRTGKSLEKKSLSTPLESLSIYGNAYQKRLFDCCQSDVAVACKVQKEHMSFVFHSLKEDSLKVNFRLKSIV